MDEPALYRAILAAPHDDTARLVYADWLDEYADRLPEPQARLERGRAALVRVQCAVARRGAGGWGWNRELPIGPELARRQKRLRFLYSAELRRGLPAALAGHPFDRGFLRPFRSVLPHEFLRDPTAAPEQLPGGRWPTFDPVPPLPPDHPMRRYVPGDDPFAAFPLWDLHLFAPDYAWHPWSDRGQYGAALVLCSVSPAMARVGWLKVSFFHTPTLDFFRTGEFPNVETLVLNCAPFPEVLEAVAENESFRSLRYVHFGADAWAWCLTGAGRERLAQLQPKLAEANGRHLPYGEMRAALRAILGGLPPIPRVRLPLRMPDWARPPTLPSAGAAPDTSRWVRTARPRQTTAEAPLHAPSDRPSGTTTVLVALGALIAVLSLITILATPPKATPHSDSSQIKAPLTATEVEKWNPWSDASRTRTTPKSREGPPAKPEAPPEFLGPRPP